MKKSNWTVHFETHQLSIVQWVQNSARRSGLFYGILIGFILNTIIATVLAQTYADLNSAAVIDEIVENKLSHMEIELGKFKEEFTPDPPSAKELNDQR